MRGGGFFMSLARPKWQRMHLFSIAANCKTAGRHMCRQLADNPNKTQSMMRNLQNGRSGGLRF